MEPIIGKLTDNDGTHLTINSLQGERAFGTSKSIQARDCPGYLVRGDSISEWRVSSIRDIDGKIAFVGPDFEGRPLSDVIGGTDPLPALVRFIRAAARLAESGGGPFCFNPALVLLADDGAVFFIPYEISRIVSAQVPEEVAAATFIPYEAPDLSGEAALSFTFGALCYRALTSRCAFAGPTRYAIEADMRDEYFLPLDLAAPDVSETVSSITDRSLLGARTAISRSDRSAAFKRSARTLVAVRKAPSIGEWEKAALELEGGRTRTTLSAQEASRKSAKKEKFQRRERRRVSVSRFRRKYSGILVGAAIGLTLTAIIVGTVIQNQWDANHTIGLSPTDVIRTYYRGLNELNQSLMEECLTGKTGSADLNLVMNFFVVSRVRLANESVDYFVPAQKWVDAGMPAYNKPYDVIGATGLDFIEGNVTPTEAEFRIAYVLWIPNRSESNPNAPPLGTRQDKRIHLTRDTERNRWYIDALEDVESTTP